MIHSTIRAGLIGEHLSHSYSKEIHAHFADYDYRLIELAPEAVGEFLQNGDFDALNVTIPYKKTVIPYLAGISDTAARIGAVNTIVRRPDGSLSGYNTDYDGLADLIDSLGVSLKGKKVLVLGSGGASRTAQVLAADRGAEVVIISRQGENNYQNLDRHADARVIINTTPVGMYPNNGQAPLSLAGFPQLEAVFDLIYNPARTALLMEAEQLGIPHANGLLMLVSQARRAVELFLNTDIPKGKSATVTQKMAGDAENIVLIGMPGCGKTTLGNLLAKELGKTFVDADEALVRHVGKPIADIFANEGEAAFRRYESEVLTALGREKGQVIATGGGAVTVSENYPLLHQNARIVFLDIPPEGLSVEGRPLSQSRTPEVLYRERLPLYRKFADLTVAISRDVAENLTLIKEALK